MYTEIASSILQTMDSAQKYAASRVTCKRKAVGCAAVRIVGGFLDKTRYTYNGPSISRSVCTNIVGNCGCSHAEPRMVMKLLHDGYAGGKKFVLLCEYSPCTNCANIILDSNLFHGIIYHKLTEHDVRGRDYLLQAWPLGVLTTDQLVAYINDSRYEGITLATKVVVSSVRDSFDHWSL